MHLNSWDSWSVSEPEKTYESRGTRENHASRPCSCLPWNGFKRNQIGLNKCRINPWLGLCSRLDWLWLVGPSVPLRLCPLRGSVIYWPVYKKRLTGRKAAHKPLVHLHYATRTIYIENVKVFDQFRCYPIIWQFLVINQWKGFENVKKKRILTVSLLAKVLAPHNRDPPSKNYPNSHLPCSRYDTHCSSSGSPAGLAVAHLSEFAGI